MNRILPKFSNLNCEETGCNGVKYNPQKDADSYYGWPKSEPFNPTTSFSAPPHLLKNADPPFPLPICYGRAGPTHRNTKGWEMDYVFSHRLPFFPPWRSCLKHHRKTDLCAPSVSTLGNFARRCSFLAGRLWGLHDWRKWKSEKLTFWLKAACCTALDT